MVGEPVAGRVTARSPAPASWRGSATRWRDPATLAGHRLPARHVRPAARAGLRRLTVWLVLLAGITLPAWYWAPWQTFHRRERQQPISPRRPARLLPERPARPPGLRPLRRHAAEGAARRRRLPDPLPAVQLRRSSRPPARTRPSRARCSRAADDPLREAKGSCSGRPRPASRRTSAPDCPRPRGSSSRAGTRPRLTHQHLLRPQRGTPMRQPHSSVLPISPPDEAHDPPPPRPNLTERVAGWSARHRKTAVFGWLLLVAAIFMAARRSARGTCRRTTQASPGRRSGRCTRSRPGSTAPTPRAC